MSAILLNLSLFSILALKVNILQVKEKSEQVH